MSREQDLDRNEQATPHKLDEARSLSSESPDLWVAIARLRLRRGEHLSALEAADREMVDRVYQVALTAGGSCEGPPGERNPGFYAAYFRDPDGNKCNAFLMGQG